MKENLSLKNIVALIAVVLIWGYVFKTRFNFFGSDTELAVSTVQESFYLPKQYGKDTFQLNLTNSDPFLKGIHYKKKQTNSSNQSNTFLNKKRIIKPSNNNTTKIKSWPKLSYYGYVKNKSKGKKQACLVEINNVVHKMSIGDEFYSVKLINVFKDSIIVSFEKELKTIKKNS